MEFRWRETPRLRSTRAGGCRLAAFPGAFLGLADAQAARLHLGFVERAAIAALAAETAPRWLWEGPFRQLANSQVESGFADHRTYLYGGEEIDQQVHLGFDLASTANAPVLAANAGTVVFADFLGIFGRCVIIDHGTGLQSLYAHLSSFDVAPGMSVARDQQLGLSGQSGLAGGDHLHFAMLLQGRPVTPMEWWDAHWIEDRILRKLREAGPAAASR